MSTGEAGPVGEGEDDEGPAVDTPPLAPLKDYIKVLDDWAAGRPCALPWLGELVEARGFGDSERREFVQGRDGLWKLIPPITQAEIEEVELEPQALLALGLAVVLRGRHGLAALDVGTGRSLPVPLREVESLSRYLSEQLEASGRRSVHGSIARLAALRLDLQEQRRTLRQRDEGLVAAASLDVGTGIATARISERRTFASRVLGGLRRVTEPGMARLRGRTSPDRPAEVPEQEEWKTDPQVPAPLGLYQYVASLDHWLARTAMDEPFLESLLNILGFGDEEREVFRSGRAGLWGLVPPIDAAQVAEADLKRPDARALTVAVAFWARHLLAWYAPDQKAGLPPELRDAGDIVTALRLVLGEEWGKETDSVAGRRLFELAVELEIRGVVGISALEERRAAIVQARFDEVDARQLREMEAFETARQERLEELGRGRRIPVLRLGVGGAILVSAIAIWLLQPGGDYLPPARSYGAVPAVAIIRHQELITIRVDRAWLELPKEQREGQMKTLWERFGRELDRPEDPVDLAIVNRVNDPLGGYKLGLAWWDPTVEVPEEEAEPAEAP